MVKAYYTNHFVLPLPSGHRFPMEKYKMLRDQVSVLEGIYLYEAPKIADHHLALAHDMDYIERINQGLLSSAEQREIGFPWSSEMVERSKRSAGATLEAAKSALIDKVAVNLAGGTHHAYRDKGSGFCVFNDAAITALYLQREHGLRVAIVDLDVHQGNGTASILKEHPGIFTLSLHGDKNFPFRKESGSLDISLPDGCEDDLYLAELRQALALLQGSFKPQFVIYLAGADPHEGDRLGRLRLTMTGMAQRDQKVFKMCEQLRCPVAVAMAGGYGHSIQTTVDVHVQTIQLALAHHQKNKAFYA
jgi:acetoin utilization deacetylase AcuC-like enzyme